MKFFMVKATNLRFPDPAPTIKTSNPRPNPHKKILIQLDRYSNFSQVRSGFLKLAALQLPKMWVLVHTCLPHQV